MTSSPKIKNSSRDFHKLQMQLVQDMHTHTQSILTFIPSNLDKARRGLNALSVLRDFKALPEEQGDVSLEAVFSPQETNDSCVH